MSTGTESSNDLSALRQQLAAMQAQLAQMEGVAPEAPSADARSSPKPPGAPAAPPRPKRRDNSDAAQEAAAQQDTPDDAPEEVDAPLPPLGWREKFMQMGAWTTSLIVHCAIIIVLGLSMLPLMLEAEPPELTALQTRPEEELHQVLEQTLTPSESQSLESAQSTLKQGHASLIDGSTDPTFDQEVAESVDGPKVKFDSLSVTAVQGSQLMIDTPDEAPGDPHAVVDGYEQAMDRITQEILMMLEKGKVLVVWLFDESESMKDDQEEIAKRIHKVYDELALRGATAGDALFTGVVSYGGQFHVLTPNPTADVERIKTAISSVPVDESGKEMMCMAVGRAIRTFRSAATAGRRQMALIMVTDESGDTETNVQFLEASIAEAKGARCRIYTLGREAVFGYPFAHYLWQHPQTKQWHELPIDRGPETAYVEQLQTSGFRARKDSHGSGFGPYEQTRMARETGGIFFMLPSFETNLARDDDNALQELKQRKITREEYLARSREQRRYSLEALRPFMPNLDSRAAYAAEREASALRKALWTVIWNLNPYREDRADDINLPLQFAPRPEPFAREARAAIAKTERYVIFLNQAEKALENIRQARERETYPRWQANYDLVYAQLLAYKVRIYEYGAYLDEFMKNPPKDIPLTKPHPDKDRKGEYRLTHWYMSHREETITGEKTRDYIERSAAAFKQVIADYPNTPWAERATWELERGFGIELKPRYHFHGPSKPGPSRPKRKIMPVPKL